MVNKCTYISVLIIILMIISAGCSESVNGGNEPSGGEEEPPPSQEVDPPVQEVGINVNGQYNVLNFNNVVRSGTIWVRGFLDFFQLYPEEGNIDNDERIQHYLKLKEQGYRNILNIKWNFSNRSFPSSGSQEMQDYKSYLTKLLDKVWSSTDVIVVGNEPFIESKQSERGNRLVVFYQQIANHVKNYRANTGQNVPIFVGAFNNLYLDGWRTEAVNALMRFARNNDWIAGVDLHIHHANLDQMKDFIDYADLRIRDNQKLLITEFSLKDYFRTKMDQDISSEFASTYNLDSNMKNYEYLDSALKNNVSRQEWVNFLSQSDWFESRKRYLWDAYQIFKGYEKFHIANYALRQSYPFNKDFSANTTPWILNGLFANRTVRPDTDTGQDQRNYAWMEDFTKIQEDSQNRDQ